MPSNSYIIDSKMHTNFRDVKSWENVHLKINEIQRYTCSAHHTEML